jgi:hypothetical protein
MTATASSITATTIDSAAAFRIAHIISALFITSIELKKSVIYGGRRQVFVDWDGEFQPEIELIDASGKSREIEFNLRINLRLQPHRVSGATLQAIVSGLLLSACLARACPASSLHL